MLWRREDHPGHEWARLWSEAGRWQLAGTAVMSHEGTPCRLDYRVVCDEGWRTLYARVEGWVGDEAVRVEVAAGPDGRWRRDGEEVAAVRGCVDVDLAFSPSTNLLPIRRLGLAVGERAEATAAWLTFPALALEPLPQVYERVAEDLYRYESGGGAFRDEIRVNAAGFPVRYIGWRAEP